MLTEFGKLLREHRIKRNILLIRMADNTNIGSAKLSAFETGKEIISDADIDRIATYLELSNDDKTKLLSADRTFVARCTAYM